MITFLHFIPEQDHIGAFKGRAVVLVRNPYKAILSYWNFFNTIQGNQLIIVIEKALTNTIISGLIPKLRGGVG